MHKNINQLKMGTLLSYVTIAIQNISAIIYTPLMLRFLGQNEYGVLSIGQLDGLLPWIIEFGIWQFLC